MQISTTTFSAALAVASFFVLTGCGGHNAAQAPVDTSQHLFYVLRDVPEGTAPQVLTSNGTVVPMDVFSWKLTTLNPGDSVAFAYGKATWSLRVKELTFRSPVPARTTKGGISAGNVELLIADKPGIAFSLSANDPWNALVMNRFDWKPAEVTGQEAISNEFQRLLDSDGMVKDWGQSRTYIYVTTLRLVEKKLMSSDQLVTWWSSDASDVTK